MSDSERVKGLLDGTVDPSELEGDPELYSLAERISVSYTHLTLPTKA